MLVIAENGLFLKSISAASSFFPSRYSFIAVGTSVLTAQAVEQRGILQSKHLPAS